MDKEFWLRLLGLTGNPNLPDIKRAWKKRAGETHPDHGGSKEDFVEVTHAYKMLTDESYRRNQDDRKREREVQNLALNMKVHIEWLDAFFGREITVSWNQVEVGEHNIPLKSQNLQNIFTETVQIPEGYQGDQRVFPGKGLKKGIELGDCVIQFNIIQDKRYSTISEIDIACQENVPLELLLTGGKVDIETPWGIRKMTIKPGTVPGSNIVIKKAGVRKFGSLVVKIMPKFPGQEELKSEAYRGMKIEWDIKDENEDGTLTPEEAEIIGEFMEFTKNRK